MRTVMTRRSLIAAIAVLATAAPALLLAHGGHTHYVRGTITDRTSVSSSSNTL